MRGWTTTFIRGSFEPQVSAVNVQPIRREYYWCDAICDVIITWFRTKKSIKNTKIFVSRNSKTAAKIREYYDQSKVVKQYLAITKNVPESNEGEINIPLIRRSINGKYKVNEFYENL